jgi:hypothetical protein
MIHLNRMLNVNKFLFGLCLNIILDFLKYQIMKLYVTIGNVFKKFLT